jgi:hypothetical protein
MAQERNLGTARALDADEDATKAELQRQMEEARESISQTVTEIKETVTTQYQNMKESVTEALDWREQFRKRPVAFSVGALSVGFLVGYSVAGAVTGSDEPMIAATHYPAFEFEEERLGSSGLPSSSRSSAAQSTLGGAYAPASTSILEQGESRPSYSSGYTSSPEEMEPDKPGLIERFRGTAAYDRLQDELGTIGNRFVDQLSTVAQDVVLPALFLKIKDLIGVDLTTPENRSAANRQPSSLSSSGTAPAGTPGSGSTATQRPRGSSGAGTTGSTYGTSENQSSRIENQDAEGYRQGNT